MHLFEVAFYIAGTYYGLFIDRALLWVFLAVVIGYLAISALLPKSQSISTRKKLMLGTWSPPSQGSIIVRVPVRAEKILEIIQKTSKENKITVTHFAIKAVGQLLKILPDLNGKLVFGKFVPYETVDVSCLVDVEGGKDLAMLSIRGVDQMSVEDIGSYIKEKTSKMRKQGGGGEQHKKKTKPFSFVPAFLVAFLLQIISFVANKLGLSIKALNIQKHSFGGACVTSLGMLGFEDATAPFSGFTNCVILASVNAVHEEVVIEDGKMVIGKVINMNFVVDHRYVDGGRCTKLVPALKEVFEHPQRFMNSNKKK